VGRSVQRPSWFLDTNYQTSCTASYKSQWRPGNEANVSIHLQTSVIVYMYQCAIALTIFLKLFRSDFTDNCIELGHHSLKVCLLTTARFRDNNLLLHDLVPQSSFLHSIINNHQNNRLGNAMKPLHEQCKDVL